MFSSDTPILWWGTRAPRTAGAHRVLLWPVLMHGALTAWSSSSDRELDLFQEVVLRLMNAGVVETGELAARTRINPRLVAMIVDDLAEQGYNRADGTLTEFGKATLDELSAAPTQPRLVRVFQELRTGEVWPRVTLELPYADVRWRSDGATLRLGTPGRPDDRDAIVHWPDAASPRPPVPSVSSIRDALIGHRRAERRAGRDVASLGRAKMVTAHLVRDEPKEVLIASLVYGSGSRRADGGFWDVADAFGLSGSMRLLRSEVAVAAERSDALRQALDELVDSTGAEDFDAELAREELVSEANIDRDAVGQEVFELLVQMRAAVDRAAEAPKGEAARREAVELVERALGAAHAELVARHAAPEALVDLLGHPLADGEYLDAVARRLGFGALPAALARVGAGRVRAVSEGGGSLRSQIAFALLQAVEDVSHPYRQAASEGGDLIATLDRVASCADNARRRWGAAPSQADLVELSEFATVCVRDLLATRVCRA